MGGQAVPLLAVTPAVGKNVHWVARPHHEVIDVSGLRRQRLAAVKAAPSLNVDQNRMNHGQRRPFAAEQEFVQVSVLTQYAQVQLA